ncbi:MAG: metal ABC transporter ATP-binding protein [Thermosphaera sp.]
MRIALDDLTIIRGGKLIVKNLTATFKGPGLIQVIGPNGAGKTTLFLTILGLIKPVSGRIYINDIDATGSPGKLKSMVSYLPQKFEIPRNLPITVQELMECCIRLNNHWPRTFSKKIDSEKIVSALKLVGLTEDFWDAPVSSLSGGQFQRVMIARTLALNTPMIIMDEPLSNIDPEGKKTIADLLGSISREKLLILSSHDPILLMPYTSRILLLGNGLAFYGPPQEVLARGVLGKIYGECFIEARDHVHIVDWH